jgi:hypothetical protein
MEAAKDLRDRKDWLLEMLSLLDRMVVRFDQCSLPTVQLHKLEQDLIRRGNMIWG